MRAWPAAAAMPPREHVQAPSGPLAGHVSGKERGHCGCAIANVDYGDHLPPSSLGLHQQKNRKEQKTKETALTAAEGLRLSRWARRAWPGQAAGLEGPAHLTLAPRATGRHAADTRRRSRARGPLPRRLAPAATPPRELRMTSSAQPIDQQPAVGLARGPQAAAATPECVLAHCSAD